MPILRLPYLFAFILVAAAALTACKGSGSSSNPTTTMAQIRFIQGNPALQTVDYQIDLSGSIITGAQPGVIQPYIQVAPTSHVISFFSSGTKNPPASPAPTNCVTPVLTVGTNYTLVLVNQAGTSATPCVVFKEPTVAPPASGQAVVIYHNAAGNAFVKDQNGNPTINLFPVFCQPQPNGAPCANPTIPSGGPIVNGAASGQTPTAIGPLPVTFGSATTSPGIAFTVTNSATGTPLCQGLQSDPTVYPVSLDVTDTGNFVPNASTTDQIIALYILDSPSATAGTNACPVTISGSLSI